MTNREMLNILKDIETFDVHIKTVIYNIIEDTFDSHICNVDEYEILDDKVIVQYEEYYYRGHGAYKTVHIPINWFDEGFDYVLAYEEQQQKIKEKREKIEAKRKKRAAEKRKKAKELKEKKEYDTYLKLKKKYENGENK